MKLDIGRRFANFHRLSILSMPLFVSVESFAEISDSVCVGQKWGDDERVILFVKMVGERPLSDQLVDRLKLAIRQQLSARHVPAIIMQIADIPVLLSCVEQLGRTGGSCFDPKRFFFQSPESQFMTKIARFVPKLVVCFSFCSSGIEFSRFGTFPSTVCRMLLLKRRVLSPLLDV